MVKSARWLIPRYPGHLCKEKLQQYLAKNSKWKRNVKLKGKIQIHTWNKVLDLFWLSTSQFLEVETYVRIIKNAARLALVQWGRSPRIIQTNTKYLVERAVM